MEDEEKITPTAQSAAPPTDPRGLPLGDDVGVRDILLAFRGDWESWKDVESLKSASMVGSLKLLDARQGVIESDIRQLRDDVAAAKATADGARTRADTAHTMAETASVAAGKSAIDHEAEKEGLLAALASTRGELQAVTASIGTLKTTDEELKAMVAAAAKDSAGAAIREAVGKNPRFVQALTGVLIVLATVLTQRFVVSPAAPNQGALPGPTPTVHTVGGDAP